MPGYLPCSVAVGSQAVSLFFQSNRAAPYSKAVGYDPMLGRFTSPDSIIPEPGSVIGYNRFAYVNNNPMIYTDPSGYRLIIRGDPDTGEPEIDKRWKLPIPTKTNTGNTVGGVCGSGADYCIYPGVDDVNGDGDVITHFEGLDEIAAEYGYDVVPIPYNSETGKLGQADALEAITLNNVICYSAGTDSCLLYASRYSNPEDLNIVLIGGYYVLEDGSISRTTGTRPGYEGGFIGVIDELAQKGAHILVIYDGSYYDSRDDIISGVNVQAVESYEDHYDVDERESSMWVHIFNWFNDPTYEVPIIDRWARAPKENE